MNKRLISTVLLLALLLGLVPAQALAADPQAITGKIGNLFSWELDPVEGLLRVDGTGSMPDWSYGESAPWYTYRSRVFSVELSKGITSIGAYAFNECAQLTEIDASGCALNAIGDGAMNNCILLKSVSFKPAASLNVGEDAFYGCVSLTKLDLGAASGTVGAGAFSGCAALAEIRLPQKLTRLERDTFSGCSSLAKLNVPAELEYIGKNCFRGAQALPDLSFPATLKTVERYAFSGCEKLTLRFAGDAPAFAPAKDVSASFAPDTLLCFPYDAKGWTWPVCKGYETSYIFPALDDVFHDLAKSAWYIPSVQYVYYTGLMNGVRSGEFAPNAPMTRSQLVTVLYRNAGQPEVTDAAPFTDVDKDAYYYDAVCWAQTSGIVKGVSATRFAPNNVITRQQLCTFLFRYAELLGLPMDARDPLTAFIDADKVDSYAKDAASWCVAAGLINGKNGNLLDPNGGATRAEVAKVLTAFDARVLREILTAPDRWEDDLIIPDPVPEIDREAPEYLLAREIFDAINVKRAEAGLSPFIWNDRIYLAAQVRAEEVTGENAFNHTRPDGTSYATVFTQFDVEYTTRNEIVAFGYNSAQALVDAWMTSGATSPVITATIYSQAAVGVYHLPPEKEGEEGKYYFTLLVIG